MTDELLGRGGYYQVRLTQERDEKGEIWTAEHPDLLGCHGVTRDPGEAVKELATVREEWIARAKTSGRRVPDSQQDLQYTLGLARDHTPDEREFAERAILTAAEPIPTRISMLQSPFSTAN